MVFNFRTPSFFDDSPVTEDTQPLRNFSFKELKAATRNFSHDNLLGRGASRGVFKGRLRDGSLVAIKILHKESISWCKEAIQKELEVKALRILHPNIVTLRGYCATEEEHLLVFPLMAKNSLGSYLRPSRKSGVQPLSWDARKQIALGVARGLAYLHHYCDPKIIHGSVSPLNILLDQELEAVIGNFGLAKIMHQKDLIHGTIEFLFFNDTDIEDDGDNQSTLSSGSPWKYYLYDDTYVPADTCASEDIHYVAPEYAYTGKCTLKSDVFAFGKMLLNLITGQRFIINQRDEDGPLIMYIDNWLRGRMPVINLEQLMDPDLQGHYVNREAKHLAEFAFQCAHVDPRERPEMLKVVRVLEDLGGTPQFPISNYWPMATLSRSESDSTLFYSFSSAATGEFALEASADL